MHKRIINELTELAERVIDYIKVLPWPPTADSIREIGQQAEWLSQRAFRYAEELEEKHAAPSA